MLLQLVLADIAYCMTELQLSIIAWCSDAGGDSANMRRQLVRKMPWIIVLDCWAHQVCRLYDLGITGSG